jgi:hypothetical protein
MKYYFDYTEIERNRMQGHRKVVPSELPREQAEWFYFFPPTGKWIENTEKDRKKEPKSIKDSKGATWTPLEHFSAEELDKLPPLSERQKRENIDCVFFYEHDNARFWTCNFNGVWSYLFTDSKGNQIDLYVGDGFRYDYDKPSKAYFDMTKEELNLFPPLPDRLELWWFACYWDIEQNEWSLSSYLSR